jgi:hypothetical protein
MKGWRLTGVIVFALFALMELGDLAGLLPGFNEPARSQYADLIGITPQAEGTRLVILSVLALGIVINAIVVVVGLVRRSRLALRAVLAAAIVFWLYGAYQLVAAATQLSKNQMGVAIAGVVYTCVGVLALWLGRKAALAEH